jgi:hypothetical protein
MGDMAGLIAKQGVAPVVADFVFTSICTLDAFGKQNIFI